MRASPIGDLEDILDRMAIELPIKASAVAIDLVDREEEYVLKANLPGFSRDEIDVALQGDRLTISARRDRVEEVGFEDTYLKRERERREVSRTVTLPETIDPSTVEARYEAGVLEVVLPKPVPTEAHRIDVS